MIVLLTPLELSIIYNPRVILHDQSWMKCWFLQSAYTTLPKELSNCQTITYLLQNTKILYVNEEVFVGIQI
jgi:hypothetical protein